MGKKALIVGASGLIGRHCLETLLDHDAYDRVIALVRKRLARAHPKLEQRTLDFDRLSSSSEPFPAVDDVFCCLGAPMHSLFKHRELIRVDYIYPRKIALLALKAGATHFALVTSGGIGPKSPIFYCRVKARIEAAITALPFRSVHVFRPSFLIDRPYKESRSQWAIGRAIRPATVFFRGPLASIRPISSRAVGCIMVDWAAIAASGYRLATSGMIHQLLKERS